MHKESSQMGGAGEPKLSRATVGRFSLYLRTLQALARDGVETINSSQLGEALGVTDAQVRKDLAYLGKLGYAGIGYYPQELAERIRQTLGLDRPWIVVMVGAGNLARALLRYRGFQEQGFRIAAVFDNDPAKIGQKFDELTIRPTVDIPSVVSATSAELGLVTVPAAAAQSVADSLVAAGIRGILNFAPTVVKTPPGVRLVSVDLTVQLEQLAFLVRSEQLCE
jgi:redox-sensing transcriptional repressor